MKLVLTCEHAGNAIPEKYSDLFTGKEELLSSHRGYDPGAYDLFLELQELSDFSRFCPESRLLVELNRSLHHPHLLSAVTKKVSRKEKEEILENCYFPYRNSIEEKIASFLRENEVVLHLSVHSFTPVLEGEVRRADIGLLYDPQRGLEKTFSKILKQQLVLRDPGLNIRFNYPYLGKADGFTTFLRKKFPENYLGIELEVNQKFVSANRLDVSLKNTISEALSASHAILSNFSG